MEVKEVSLSKLVPYEKNPRKNDNAVKAVANSIKQFGFKVPVVIDADNIIVCGHTRFKAAQKLGLESVPCIVAGDLTPEQIKAFRLADNKVSELALWDDALLLDEIDDLKMFDIDMADFGFDVSKVGKWHKSWAKTEKLCDLKKKIKTHSNGSMLFVSFYEVGKRGIPIDKIKEDQSNARLFADNLCDYLVCNTGGLHLLSGGWCLCITPRRRHKEGLHFSTEICRLAAEQLGLPFYSDVFIAENRNRIEPEFKLINNPVEVNVILYDDIISTGVTIRTCRQLLVDEGHVVLLAVGIHNRKV